MAVKTPVENPSKMGVFGLVGRGSAMRADKRHFETTRAHGFLDQRVTAAMLDLEQGMTTQWFAQASETMRDWPFRLPVSLPHTSDVCNLMLCILRIGHHLARLRR